MAELGFVMSQMMPLGCRGGKKRLATRLKYVRLEGIALEHRLQTRRLVCHGAYSGIILFGKRVIRLVLFDAVDFSEQDIKDNLGGICRKEVRRM